MLRREEGKESFGDVESAMKEVKAFQNGLEHFDFKKWEIITLENPDLKSVAMTFKDLMSKVYENEQIGESTFIYVYYVGHGLVDNNLTHMVLNG